MHFILKDLQNWRLHDYPMQSTSVFHCFCCYEALIDILNNVSMLKFKTIAFGHNSMHVEHAAWAHRL